MESTEVAIPSITGLHSYDLGGEEIVISVMSQSLLLQVFIHTLNNALLKEVLDMSQSLLLQVFIHTYREM